MIPRVFRLVAMAFLAALAGFPAGLLAADPAASTKEQVEADWLTQLDVRGKSSAPGAAPAAATTKEDAAGGCDGVKDGKWGFHTDNEDKPWWQVDLGESRTLARVLVYNRTDRGTAGRAANLVLLVSDDGKAWREAYRHSGTEFLGQPDKKPLTIPLDGAKARFVRIRLPGQGFLHLDEVEVYSAADAAKNLALGRPADQSSISEWSTRKSGKPAIVPAAYPMAEVLDRGKRLAEDLRQAGVDTAACERALSEVAQAAKSLAADAPADAQKELYFKARWAVRKLALANPLLDFDSLVFAKHAPATLPHMSDQYYGWWSRSGGSLSILENFRGEKPQVRSLTASLPDGSFLRPDLSYDGKKVLFAFAKYYPHLSKAPNKVAKDQLPEDSFYHVYEVNVDGTGLRQLTRGRYDDFDARYLPSGEILFLSTRRGQFIQCGQASAAETTRATLPDSFVRCGGDNLRPVAVYTLHVMDGAGGNLRAISPFENFEWTPSVASDGRILYARWDYVDRDNMPFMKLWSTNPDGTNSQAVYGNYTRSPHCAFEARSIPGSHKIIFTAGGHHTITGGSLALLDTSVGNEGADPVTRLTPEVCFPETEGWPRSYYASPWPLSEKHYLVAWSNRGMPPHRGSTAVEGNENPVNAQGLYLYDVFGNLELIYRDAAISSHCPIPLKARPRPPVVASSLVLDGPQEGRFLLQDVYQGLPGVERGTIKRLRIVAMPAKTQPFMNTPMLGVTRDDPGKCVLGTVPVEDDGSAYFRAPSGVVVFFQALDGEGKAVQTMRSLTYVQPGQTLSCVGCHERRDLSPATVRPVAMARGPSKLTPGPDGSWPLRFDRLVQPVLDKSCVRCHQPGYKDQAAAKYDLTPKAAYQSLIKYGGTASLHDHVRAKYYEGRSPVGDCEARKSVLLGLLQSPKGHYDVRLDADSLERLFTWMDTYAQNLGSFSEDQEQRLLAHRKEWADMLEAR